MALLRGLVILALLVGLSGCSWFSNDKDPYKDESEAKIFNTAETQLAKHNYGNSIKAFEALDTHYPFSKNAQQAQLDIIYAYYKYNDPASALAAANRYIHLYPQASDVDYAYYMRAVTRFNQNRTFFQHYLPIDLSRRDLSSAEQSFGEFEQVIRLFPDSPYAVDSRQRMIYIRDLIAQHELGVADFYYVRKMYLASANRASHIILHYQNSGVVSDALVMLVKSYDNLGLYQGADQALEILAVNYPSSKQYKQAAKYHRKAIARAKKKANKA